jgi:hypothetical protein
MLFTPPPGYGTAATNAQSNLTRGNAGRQAVQTQPAPAFPGALTATGGVSPQLPPTPGTSSFSVPSSMPNQFPPNPVANPLGKSNVHNVVKALRGI